MFVATHPAPQLVQVGQAIAVRFVNEDGICVGNIETALHDGCRQQKIKAVGDKIDHHLREPIFWHLTMADLNPGFGNDFPQPHGNAFDILHTIVYEKDLAIAVEFAKGGMANHFGVKPGHSGFHSRAIFWRGFQVGDISCTE